MKPKSKAKKTVLFAVILGCLATGTGLLASTHHASARWWARRNRSGKDLERATESKPRRTSPEL